MGILTIKLPEWVNELAKSRRFSNDDSSRMALAIELARLSSINGGGPFGAAIFDRNTGAFAGAGVNMVVAERNSVLHAEVVAIMMAESALGSYTLGGGRQFEIFSSCAPCAMCLGAILWSGLSRLVCGAESDDARRIGFDEGPVFEESYSYLEKRGIEVVRGFMREQAVLALNGYAESGGVIYNR